jgi:trk system potassium uptake protein TrkH
LRKHRGEIHKKEGFTIVTFTWIVTSAIGSLPFVFSGSIPYYVDAYFEAMSGFTTTGASILQNVESLPKGILFWRSFTQWLGGMGIIVLFIAVLPFLGVGGRQLYTSEVPGPTPEGLKPRIKQTARLLWFFYVGLSAAEVILLYLFGMSLFDSFCHTFTTMATGGFSTKNDSIGHFQSFGIQITVIFFMLCAGTNFALYYRAFKGSISCFWKDSEFRSYLAAIILSILLVFAFLLIFDPHYEQITPSALDASFQVVSILTTTGYTTIDFDQWIGFPRFFLFLLMFVGGCAGSTGGSIKIVRLLVMTKYVSREIYHAFRPHAVKSLKLGKQVIPDHVVSSITGFILIYFLSFGLLSCLMMVTEPDLDMTTAFTSVAATIGNVGPGLAGVGPAKNFYFISDAGKMILSFCMLLGRLELFTVLVLFSPTFWRK